MRRRGGVGGWMGDVDGERIIVECRFRTIQEKLFPNKISISLM